MVAIAAGDARRKRKHLDEWMPKFAKRLHWSANAWDFLESFALPAAVGFGASMPRSQHAGTFTTFTVRLKLLVDGIDKKTPGSFDERALPSPCSGRSKAQIPGLVRDWIS